MNRKWIFAVLAGAACSTAYAASYNRVPNALYADASATCGAVAGNQCYITDCLTALCTTGGGTEDALLQYNGSAWVLVASAASGGASAVSGTTADTFTLDSDGDAFVLSPAVGGLTLQRAAAGVVTLTAADDDSTAAMTVDPGGAAALTLGSIDVTSISAIVDNDFQLQNGATGSVTFDFRDYADTTDDDQAHAILTTNCTDTGTGAEDCDFSIGVAEAGAAAETRFAIDADGDITVGSANNGGVTLLSTGVSTRNSATGSVTFDFRDYADTTDDDQAHTLLTTNCTDTSSGAEDCDFTVGIVEAGAAPETRLSFDADGDITVGSANGGAVLALGSPTSTASLRNNATGTVGLDFRDYADTTDDDMAHGVITSNCTDTSTGAEDCDLTVGVVEAGAAAETRLSFDADGGIELGSANNNTVTLTTDSTGNAELVVPADSVGASEIDDAACTSVVAVSYNPTEAGATDDYVSLKSVDTGTGDASFSATETGEDQFIAPVAIKAVNLYAQVDVAPGAGNDAWVITLREAAGSTTLTCTIDEAATTCSDAVNQEAIAQGAKLDVLVTSSTGGGADPTAAAELQIAFCLTPD